MMTSQVAAHILTPDKYDSRLPYQTGSTMDTIYINTTLAVLKILELVIH